MSRHRLSPLFDPGSVALYGATEREGALGRLLLETLRASGFQGPIGAINPKRRTVLGEPCVRSAAALDFVPDVALATVPAHALAAVVDDCADKGTRFVVVYATGFETATEAGRAAQAELLGRARARGVRLVGPHCMALMRPASGFDAGFSPGRVKAGRVAMLSQSGAVITALLDWAAPSGIGFSSVLSLGSALDLDFGELLDWYLFDPQTDSVLLYIEGVRDARGFMSSVRALSRVKPVVIMKAGRASDAGRTVGASHSDALTGNDRVFEAAIARAGAVRANTTFQLLAAARLLALRRRPGGPRLAIVANGGGPGVIAADAVAACGLELAELSVATLATLGANLPGHGSRRNPVNLLTDADPARIEAALKAVLADPGVDTALALFVPQTVTTSAQAAEAIVRAADGQPKLLAAVIAGGASAAAGQRRLDEAGIPQFLSPENAVDALALLQRFAINQQKLRQVPVAVDVGFEPNVAAAEAIYRSVIAAGRTLLDEVESKALLAHFGIEAPPSIVAATPADAAQAASRLRPDVRVSGVVVQPMIRTRHQRELYVGMATDPMFGAVIAFGAGGIAVEQIDDVAIGLPPLNGLLARSMVQRTRVARVLRAYRNVPGIDFQKLEQTLVRFSALVCACPWIESLDINPLLVDEDRVTALDARIAVKTPADLLRVHWRGAYGHLAIHPYPRELEETVTLKHGVAVLLRPIRPEDAELEREFVAALSPQTLYRRFMMPVKELSDAMIERFTQIDYDRELALVALRNESGGTPGAPGSRLAGVARIIPTWDDGTAEFAIVVGDWLQHSGLGRALMLRLLEAGRVRGYSVIEGIILGENVSMLRFCERLGFTITLNPDDPAERIARITIG